MRILVTGREGQVARCLAGCAPGRDVVYAARPELDLTNFGSIERIVEKVRPDVVVSAAAYTAVDRAEDEPDLAMLVNGEAPGVLARAAAQYGTPIIHLSTDYVFDGSGHRPWREADAVSPLSAYGRSKAAGEEAIRCHAPDHAIVRTAWVYSPFGNNFVKTMLRLAGERSSIAVVDDQVGCPTSGWTIAASVAAILACWEREGAAALTGTYHLAGRGEASWAEFAEAIFAQSRIDGGPSAEVEPISTREFPTRAIRPMNSRLDIARFVKTFGYCPPHWRDALAPVVQALVAEI